MAERDGDERDIQHGSSGTEEVSDKPNVVNILDTAIRNMEIGRGWLWYLKHLGIAKAPGVDALEEMDEALKSAKLERRIQRDYFDNSNNPGS